MWRIVCGVLAVVGMTAASFVITPTTTVGLVVWGVVCAIVGSWGVLVGGVLDD